MNHCPTSDNLKRILDRTPTTAGRQQVLRVVRRNEWAAARPTRARLQMAPPIPRLMGGRQGSTIEYRRHLRLRVQGFEHPERMPRFGAKLPGRPGLPVVGPSQLSRAGPPRRWRQWPALSRPARKRPNSLSVYVWRQPDTAAACQDPRGKHDARSRWPRPAQHRRERRRARW
jgi:hypothetical protein